MSYDSDPHKAHRATIIERSPDHWWVTISFNCFCIYDLLLKGHQIIGELRSSYWNLAITWDRLKGHQIIGELRSSAISSSIGASNWKVTRSLVSYDKDFPSSLWREENWKVTRSLVSYDKRAAATTNARDIERSPDHWWVTILLRHVVSVPLQLKGHQIIGELR